MRILCALTESLTGDPGVLRRLAEHASVPVSILPM